MGKQVGVVLEETPDPVPVELVLLQELAHAVDINQVRLDDAGKPRQNHPEPFLIGALEAHTLKLLDAGLDVDQGRSQDGGRGVGVGVDVLVGELYGPSQVAQNFGGFWRLHVHFRLDGHRAKERPVTLC